MSDSEQSYEQIINALNVGNHEEALSIIETKQAEGSNQVELEYWKAQAFSQRAGVDVYSLFPLMKMKLFDVAISEWGEVNEQADRTRSRLNTTFFGVQSVGNKEELSKQIEELKKTDPTMIEYTLGSFDNYDHHSDYGASCFRTYSIKSKHFPDPKSDSLKLEWSSYMEPSANCDDAFAEYLKDISDSLKLRVRSNAIALFEKKIRNIDSRTDNQRYLKAALSLYESVPVMREIPSFDDMKLIDVYNALAELRKVRVRTKSAERLGRNSQQQMGMLSAFLIAGSIKKSINLDEVKEPFDLVCKTRAEVLVENYPHFRNGLVYLLESVKGTDFEKKNLENIEKLRLQIDQTPDELSSEEREKIIDSINAFIAGNC